jgi:cytochrome P450
VTDVLKRKGTVSDTAKKYVLKSTDEFTIPSEIAQLTGLFGDNVATTEGKQWQRHRKITASCFNEQPNPLVWSESIRQATGMLQCWL